MAEAPPATGTLEGLAIREQYEALERFVARAVILGVIKLELEAGLQLFEAWLRTTDRLAAQLREALATLRAGGELGADEAGRQQVAGRIAELMKGFGA